MVKNRVEFREGKFTDYLGNERKYIVAAVSERMPEASMVIYENNQKVDEIIINDVCKKLSLGFAVCSPEDKWDIELGKTIALGKAVKRPARVLFATHSGMINTEVVNALINQEMKYFENSPGSVIAGYNEAEAKYKAKHQQQDK